MDPHPNVTRAYEGFDAFVRGDIEVLVGLMDEHAVWRVRGKSSVAGEHRGRDAIFAFLGRTAELTDRTYRALDIQQALLVALEDGRWKEIDAVPFEQYAFDEFWS